MMQEQLLRAQRVKHRQTPCLIHFRKHKSPDALLHKFGPEADPHQLTAELLRHPKQL
jgi:hypothetical protein